MYKQIFKKWENVSIKSEKGLYSSKMSEVLRSSASSYSESVVSVSHISFPVVKSYPLSLAIGSMSMYIFVQCNLNPSVLFL